MIVSTKEPVKVRAKGRRQPGQSSGSDLDSKDGVEGAANLSELVQLSGGMMRIACDTEFAGTHTLTAQFAIRVGADVVVQIYRSPDVPQPPRGFDPNTFLPKALHERCG